MIARSNAWLFAALFWLFASVGFAQSTGGSFGSRSGSWGASGSSSSGSSRSSGSSHGSSRSSRSDFGASRSDDHSASPSSSGGGGGDYAPSVDSWTPRRRHLGAPPVSAAERAAITPDPAPLPMSHLYAIVVASLFALSWAPVLIRRSWRARKARSKASDEIAPPPRATLHRLSVGFDWTVREALQSEIDALARTLSLDGDTERGDAARAVASCLRAHLSGARYAVATVERVALRAAPGALDRVAIDLRARFAHETRGARATTAAGELEARPDEGPGLLVVSLLTGSTRDATATPIENRADLERALDALTKPDRLDGLEVVWSPAEPDDRMSSFELERFYPELRRLAEAGAVGAIACPHCGAPRPAELAACPRCGSPATT